MSNSTERTGADIDQELQRRGVEVLGTSGSFYEGLNFSFTVGVGMNDATRASFRGNFREAAAELFPELDDS